MNLFKMSNMMFIITNISMSNNQMVAVVQLDFNMWHACESWAPQHNLHIYFY